MSPDFKILQEHTFHYKNNKEFCMMLLKADGTYGVEVVNQKESFGRINCKVRKQAESIFNSITHFVYPRLTYEEVCRFFQFLRKANTQDKILFLLRSYNKTRLSQTQIGNIIDEFGLTIKSAIRKDQKMAIKVFFPKERKPFGEFNGTFLKKNFAFNINSI